MKVMVIVKASKSSEAGEMPSKELLTEMGKFNEELAKAGIMLDGAGLHPSSKAARVRFSGKNRTVIDGPFAETKELIAGYWIWKVKSMPEAIEWVKRCPNPMNEESDIEIRQFFEADDFGEEYSSELREQVGTVRATAMGLGTIRFEDGKELRLAGLSQHYTKDACHGIPNQWERFVPEVERTAGLVKVPLYGVCYNPQPNCEFDYMAAAEVTDASKLPRDFTTLTIAPSRYAVFTHTAHVSTIAKTIEKIMTKWSDDDCSVKVKHAPSFERYTADYNPQAGLGGIEIWVPVAAS